VIYVSESKKIIAARRALEYIEDDFIIGIGSGSTVKYFIKFLGDALKNGELQGVKGIPSSIDTRILMRKANIPIADLVDFPELDVTIDGADSVLTDKKILIKGGGGAFLREKIICYAAKKLIIIVDDSKINRHFPIPLEVLPFALGYVIREIEKLGGEVKLRECKGKVGPCISDNGNIIVDAFFAHDKLNPELEIQLNRIPGILENGIFSKKCSVIVGISENDVEILEFSD